MWTSVEVKQKDKWTGFKGTSHPTALLPPPHPFSVHIIIAVFQLKSKVVCTRIENINIYKKKIILTEVTVEG